ncbi:tyrosine-type recombinase/integrase [Streptomyces spectabilis]|uniref:tyrosine-type recombinase/integrase n=1 Tax=Streptomyces spectabilis TaxID=68270 RepID=UPI0033FBDBA7
MGSWPAFSAPASTAASASNAASSRTCVEVELPWGGPEPERGKRTFPLALTTTYGNALRANIFNDEVWKPTLAVAGVIPMREEGQRWKASRKDGFHVLRHTFASVILEAGESVVTLARWLGHSSPTITLDHYAHLMPEAGGKGRAAVDALLGVVPEYVPDDIASV